MADTARVSDVFGALYQDCDGLVEFRALPSKAQQFFDRDDFAGMLAFMAAHVHENCFFGVSTRRTPASGALDNSRDLPALYIDIDFKDTAEPEARQRLAASPVPPSAVVRSGVGLHAYWFLKECVELSRDAAAATAMLRRLAAYFGSDVSVAEPARVLRIPGTKNHKYDPPRVVRVEHFGPEARYNLADFDWLPATAPIDPHESTLDLSQPVANGQRKTPPSTNWAAA